MNRFNFIKTIGLSLLGISCNTKEMLVPYIVENKSNDMIDFKACIISDIHIKPIGGSFPLSDAGIPNFLNTHNNLSNISLTISVGDNIESNTATPVVQWTNFVQSVKNKTPEFLITRGNHDYAYTDIDLQIPSVNTVESNTSYYTHIKGTWKFIVLNSMRGGNYGYGLDQNPISDITGLQYNWLKAELDNSIGKNICIITHANFMGSNAIKRNMRRGMSVNYTGAFENHYDGLKMYNLIKQYSNVKICFSGHSHVTCDDKDPETGIRFIGCPALSGDWWSSSPTGNNPDSAGYILADFLKNGKVKIEFKKS